MQQCVYLSVIIYIMEVVMALDSFKIRENKSQIVEEKSLSISEFKKLIDSLPTNDIDQEWVKENENKEVRFSQQSTSPNQDKDLDDIMADLDRIANFDSRFQMIREQNNQRRSYMRNQQMNSLKQQLNYEEMDLVSISKSF